MNKETIIAVIMIGLIILAGVQAIEISGMKSDLVGNLGQPSANGAGAQGATRYSSSASSSAGMVGGC
ncbi:MAG TPA: hypothetical protein VJH37_02120 [Candidatus Nanoarchaeia archaeon]|nr:hypothetical protein [Candidatus Nanoarchaeia archaeon]